MIYPYRCDCGLTTEVVRHHSEAGLPVACSCGMTMQRVWTVPAAHVAGDGAYYDHGLGCMVKNKADAQHMLRAKGIEPVEVGTERTALRSIRPQEHSYELPRGALDGYVE